MLVARGDVFRPCAAPDLDAPNCELEPDGSVGTAHLAWYARQAARSYRVPGGFPWTRLGYTYDWASEETEVVVPELVVRKGAVVEVLLDESVDEHCAPTEDPLLTGS